MGSLKSRFGIRAKKKESPGAYWIKRRTSFPRGSVSGCGSMSISRSLGGCSEDEEGAGASGASSFGAREVGRVAALWRALSARRWDLRRWSLAHSQQESMAV